jgi:hypothetical protein
MFQYIFIGILNTINSSLTVKGYIWTALHNHDSSTRNVLCTHIDIVMYSHAYYHLCMHTFWYAEALLNYIQDAAYDCAVSRSILLVSSCVAFRCCVV